MCAKSARSLGSPPTDRGRGLLSAPDFAGVRFLRRFSPLAEVGNASLELLVDLPDRDPEHALALREEIDDLIARSARVDRVSVREDGDLFERLLQLGPQEIHGPAGLLKAHT